jgi:hypothetical protein
MLFLMPSAQRAFFPFLEEQFPDLAAAYRSLFRQGAYLRGRNADRIESLTRQLRRKYFSARARPAVPPAPFGPRDQLALFAAQPQSLQQ